jgi:hypothetical protein
VHPELVDMDRVEKMKSLKDINQAEDYFFGDKLIKVDDLLENYVLENYLFDLENEYCLNHYNKSLNEIKEEHKETL